MSDAELMQMEQEFGGFIRRAMSPGFGMAEDYSARLERLLRARLARPQPDRRAMTRQTLMRAAVVALLAALLAIAGIVSRDASSADARTLIAKVVAANESLERTRVPPGFVRHMTVVTETVGATPTSFVLEEWFADEGRAVRAALPSGEILTLADGEGWLYVPAQNVARRVDLVAKRFEALGLGRFGLDATALARADARIVGPAVVFGRPATRVELAPKPIDQPTKDGAARSRYELVVDNATFEIRQTRTTVIDAAGVVMSEVITTVTRDELIDAGQVPSDFFRFSPPPGTRVL